MIDSATKTLNPKQILEAYRIVLRQHDYTKAYLMVYRTLHKLPDEIKHILDEAFTGPSGLGYQNPIDLLEAITFIARKAISISKFERVNIKHPLPGFYGKIHHDQTGSVTDEVIGTIAQHIGPYHWESDVDYFDGLVYRKGKPYAYVEVGWIKPYKLRDLIQTKDIKQLWLFPYSKNSKKLAPYYFVAKKAPDSVCLRIMTESAQTTQAILDDIFQ